MFIIVAIAKWFKDFFRTQLFGTGEWHTCERCKWDGNLPLHKSRVTDEKICDECSWEEYGRKHNVAWAAKRHSQP